MEINKLWKEGFLETRNTLSLCINICIMHNTGLVLWPTVEQNSIVQYVDVSKHCWMNSNSAGPDQMLHSVIMIMVYKIAEARLSEYLGIQYMYLFCQTWNEWRKYIGWCWFQFLQVNCHLIWFILSLSMLWANSADDKLVIVFLFFQENRIWHFMQIVYQEDNLHEMSNPAFKEN